MVYAYTQLVRAHIDDGRNLMTGSQLYEAKAEPNYMSKHREITMAILNDQ
jgi:hypothetical protein